MSRLVYANMYIEIHTCVYLCGTLLQLVGSPDASSRLQKSRTNVCGRDMISSVRLSGSCAAETWRGSFAEETSKFRQRCVFIHIPIICLTECVLIHIPKFRALFKTCFAEGTKEFKARFTKRALNS